MFDDKTRTLLLRDLDRTIAEYAHQEGRWKQLRQRRKIIESKKKP